MTLLKWPTKIVNSAPTASQLTQLLNSLSDVVMMLDEQHQIKMINQCWQDITGISIEQTQGKAFTDFLHPEDIPSWVQLLQNMRCDAKEVIWFRLISASGELRWCEMRLQSVEKNKLYPLSATLCDITPRCVMSRCVMPVTAVYKVWWIVYLACCIEHETISAGRWNMSVKAVSM